MYSITTLTAHPTAVFAAEELKKYLRMMLPRCGNITICPGADDKGAFRLGLMQDFSLDISDAKDPALDDIVYIDTTETGGIIAGSNYGALLIAVYRYLRFCGCRWLFPGVDGEWIPNRTGLEPVKYRHLADHRYRGQCNEGAEYQANMLETIDFTPKIGMNSYMLEFDIPYAYYSFYYDHIGSTDRKPEPISPETILQWKRQCEAEMEKRGLHFHDMGHGWTAESFGLSSTAGWTAIDEDGVPEESRQYLAQTNGKRQLWRGVPLNTNFCMSNPQARQKMARYVADYAETQNNVDFLHIWLADSSRNHCECEVCRQKVVSDWYVMLLNDIDAELTRRNLDTHLVFIVYTETFWAPQTEKLRNTQRFSMLYAPISRKYTETYAYTPDLSAVKPFALNNNTFPKGMSECLGYLKEWQKRWDGDCFCYEYHFWRHQYFDPSGLYHARLIHEDISALQSQGLSGIIEDGSQRSFFPTGFSYYVYGETLFDKSGSLEELQRDYFSHAFGEKWQEVVAYLEKIRDRLDFAYLSGLRSTDEEKGKFYNPGMLAACKEIPAITEAFAPVIAAQRDAAKRAEAVSWQMLDAHRLWVNGLAEVVSHVCVGDMEQAMASMELLAREFSRREIYMERNFDFYLAYFTYCGFGGCMVPIHNQRNLQPEIS